MSKTSGLCKGMESLQPLHLIATYIQLGLCSFILLARSKGLIENRCLIKSCWCGQAEQSVEHLYTKCRRWRRKRRKLIRSLYREGISWQSRAEKKGLAELLANERAIVFLLEYLKKTEVGGREGGKERELEWERRNDQAGEELLGA